MKVDFGVGGYAVVEGVMATFSVVIGKVGADFEFGLRRTREAVVIEQFGLEAAPKGLGVGVVLAVAAPAYVLKCPALHE